ncbi:hypothetical protein IV102_16440 [bacterium]|nr:hypothetical protein [bacterium]
MRDSAAPDGEIDVVILYVDGSKTAFQESHLAQAGPLSPCQVRSLGELRFLFRSMERYAPWVRRPLLVVQNQEQLPDWLDPTRVRVIHHDQFVPAELLPTFHGTPVYAHLHRIPDLAEHYVVWYDDHMLGRNLSPNFFFDGWGRPRAIPLDSPIPRWLGRFLPDAFTHSLVMTTRVLDDIRPIWPKTALDYYLYPHIPQANCKTWWQEFLRQFSGHSLFQGTITRRKRGTSRNYVALETLFCNWLLRRLGWSRWRSARHCAGQQLMRLCAKALNRMLGLHLPVTYEIYGIFNDSGKTKRSMAALLAEQPTIFCVNDNAYDRFLEEGCVYEGGFEVNPRSLARFRETMEKLYPHASQFERN